jgi:hypothetical protein
MGNQGTKIWKLGAFFIISLMLIAGLFSNDAFAAAGEGMIEVGGDINVVTADATPVFNTDGAFVPVGIKNYQLTFTYTLVEGNRHDMDDGVVRIKLPKKGGWAMTTPDRLIPAAHIGTDANRITLKAEFKSSNKEVWVFLPDNVSAEATDPLVVTISFRVDATSRRGGTTSADDNDYFVFTTSSRTKNGSFADLASSPEVRVGPRDTVVLTNVAAEADTDSGIDDGATPDRVNADSESVKVTFTYDANEASGNGNMDNSEIQIEIPEGWDYVNKPDDTDDDPVPALGDTGTSVSGNTVTVKNADGSLTTISFNVKAPNRRGLYEFSVMSKSENGAFTKLDTALEESQENVRRAEGVR